MNRPVTAVLLVIAMLGGPPGSRADLSQVRRYELPNKDAIELAVPAGWDETVDRPAGGLPTILLRPHEGAAFEVQVIPEWPDAPAESGADPEALREMVRSAAERIREQATEETIEIRRLQGADGVGFYFLATDRAPQPDGFKYMHQGALQVGDLTVTFTILTNDGQQAVVEEALAMLKAAVHRGTGLDQR